MYPSDTISPAELGGSLELRHECGRVASRCGPKRTRVAAGDEVLFAQRPDGVVCVEPTYLDAWFV
jgi:hypothetical protein